MEAAGYPDKAALEVQLKDLDAEEEAEIQRVRTDFEARRSKAREAFSQNMRAAQAREMRLRADLDRDRFAREADRRRREDEIRAKEQERIRLNYVHARKVRPQPSGGLVHRS